MADRPPIAQARSGRLLGLLVAALCLGSLMAVAVPAAQAAKTASLEYKGSLIAEEPRGLETKGAYEHNYGKEKLELSWVATATTTIEAVHLKPPAEWDFQTLTGHVHVDYEGSSFPPGPLEQPCDATLTARPGAQDPVFVNPVGAEESEVEVATAVPASAAVVQSSEESGNCATEPALRLLDEYSMPQVELEAREDGVGEALKLAFQPRFTEPAGLWSAPFGVSWTREAPPGAGDPYLLQINSSLSVGTSTSTTETPANAPPTTTPPVPGPQPAPGTNLLGEKIDSAAHEATFRFKATGKDAHFECELAPAKGKAKFKACTSPKTYKHL